MYLTCALLLALWTAGTGAYVRDLRHPAVLYGIVWTATLGLLALPIINYDPTSTLTITFVMLSALTFTAGSVGGGLIRLSRASQPITREAAARYLPSVAILSLITVAGVAAGLYHYQTKFGLSVLLSNPAYVRFYDRDGSGFFGILLLLPSLGVLTLSLRWMLTRQRTWGTAFILIIASAYFAILPERSTVVATSLWIAGMWAIQDLRFGPRTLRYVTLSGALLTLLIGFFIAVGNRTDKTDDINAIRYAVEANIPNAWVSAYGYLTASIPALSTLVSDPQLPMATTTPERTIFPLLRVSQIVLPSAGDRLSEGEDPAFIPFYHNTFTWLSAPLRDLGLFGAQLYILVAGLLCGMFYRAARDTRLPVWVYLYGGVFAGAILSGLTNRYSSLYWWVAAAFAFAVLARPIRKMVRRRIVWS